MSRYSLWRSGSLAPLKFEGFLVTSPLIQFENVNKWFARSRFARYPSSGATWRTYRHWPLGSGKSTLLRCINRLEEHQEGKITVMGIELTDDSKSIERVRRQVGMVFQQFNLFPHLSVLDNLTLAPIG
jgi:general L-amino acid transport system ATP-binding protein